MLTRSGYQVTWQYNLDLAIGAAITLDVGCMGSGVSTARTKALPYFSIDVETDDIAEIDIFTSMTTAFGATPMMVLGCAGIPQHNTIYNLAAPFNNDGRLIVTANFMRLRVRNPTVNIITPFALFARAWRE